MALRESANCGEVAKSESASAVLGLPAHWDSADAAPRTDWEDWWDLFTVAVTAKYSLSVNKLLRIVTTEQAPNLALMNNLNEEAAEERNVISVLFLPLGTAGRKSLTDKLPEMRVATVTLQELRTKYDEAFSKPRNRTLERFKLVRENRKKKKRWDNFAIRKQN